MRFRLDAKCFVSLMVILGGCASIESPPQDVLPADLYPARAPEPPTVPMVLPVSIGHSVEGRPIELYRFGLAARPVLIIATIHGNERTSAACAEALLERLRNDSGITKNNAVALILIANPDGFARHLRHNAHHIDLNRNFPAPNWTKGQQGLFHGGLTAASEPETKALVALIEKLNPQRILSIHSMPQPCNNYDGPGKDLAEAMAVYNGYPVKSSIGYATPGSLGSWAGIDLKIPVVTLELPMSLNDEIAIRRNQEAISEFIRH